MSRLSPDNVKHRGIVHIGFFVVLSALWHVDALVGSRTLPTYPSIFRALWTQVSQQGLAGAILSALGAILVGYALSVILGVIIGLIMGLSVNGELILNPYVTALYAVPFTAVVPALVVWFGTGFTVRVVLVILFAIFPIVINTLTGVKTAPAGLIDAVKSFGGTRMFVVAKVIAPHSLSYVVAGCRLGIGRAVTGLVVAELLVAVTGVGKLIATWSVASDLSGVLSLVAVLMALGIGLTALLGLVERSLSRRPVAQQISIG